MTIEERLAALQKMTVGELKAEWRALFGEAPRSGNVPWMRRRLAWGIQAQAYGGLSEAAERRIQELLPAALTWMPIGHAFPMGNDPVSLAKRDLSTPAPGTTITRPYKGKTVVVTVRGDGFEYDGAIYGSLTAVAKAVTGSHWNGNLFFGISGRRKTG